MKRIITLLCLLFFLGLVWQSTPLNAQVFSDNNGDFVRDVDADAATTLSDFQVPPGDDRLLVVLVEWISIPVAGGASSVDSITFGGQTLNLAVTDFENFFGTTDFYSSIWYLPLGTGDDIIGGDPIYVAFNNTSTSIVYVSAMSFHNVDQTMPIANTQMNSGTASSSTINMATSADNLVVDGIMAGSTVTEGPGQTSVFFELGSGAGASFEPASGAFVEMDWTLSTSAVFAHVSAELKQCTSNCAVPVIEIDGPSAIKVFPNPVTQSELNIRFPKTSVEGASLSLYDLTGKMITKQAVFNQDVKVRVDDFTKGIYALLIEMEGQRFWEKVVIE